MNWLLPYILSDYYHIILNFISESYAENCVVWIFYSLVVKKSHILKLHKAWFLSYVLLLIICYVMTWLLSHISDFDTKKWYSINILSVRGKIFTSIATSWNLIIIIYYLTYMIWRTDYNMSFLFVIIYYRLSYRILCNMDILFISGKILIFIKTSRNPITQALICK